MMSGTTEGGEVPMQAWLRAVLIGAVAMAVLAVLGVLMLPASTFSGRFWLYLLICGALAGGTAAFARLETTADQSPLDQMLRGLAAGNLAIGGDAHFRQVTEEHPGFLRVLRSFQSIISYLQDTAESVSTASRSITEKTRSLFREAKDQAESVSQVRHSIAQLENEIEKVVEGADILSGFTDKTSSSILEMRASIEEVLGATRNLSDFVDEISASIEEMARSVEEVAGHAESLSSFAVQNSSAMVQMDATIGQIEANIHETEVMSNQISTASQGGVAVVKETVNGLEKIQTAMNANMASMESLSQRSKEIGKILKVIREIADQTNLLALNAAIIAAQAGEHGKSFGVVAEEIRDLAERTSASTSEVGTIIQTIQKEVEQAGRVAREGTQRVEEGVRLGRAAEDNLKSIREAIETAGTSISHIARAASEQAKGSRQVTTAIEEMTGRIEQISLATREQAKTSKLINQKSVVMKELTKSVDRAMQEEAAGSSAIAEGMDQVRSSVERAQKALSRMSQAGQQIVKAVDTVAAVAQQNLAGARDLSSTAGILRQDSILMVEQLSGFRLPKPVPGGEIRVGYVRYEFNMDHAFADNVRDSALVENFNEGLVKFGYGTKLLPAVAESWDVSMDGLVYLFHLRPGALFHNGRAVTAEDVVFSWHRALDPKLGKEGQWFLSAVVGSEEYMAGKAKRIEGIRALDSRSLEVRLREPLAFFLYMLTTPEASIIPPEAVDERTLRLTKPIGCGPFRVVSADPGRVQFERFKGYYEPGIPYIDRLVFDYSSSSEDELMGRLKSGASQIAMALSSESLESLLADPFWENNTEQTVLLNTQLHVIRNDLPPGNIKEFRQALNYAVDRNGLLARYPHVRATPAKGIFPPGILGYKADRKGYYHDPDKARWLLAKAGFPQGLDLTIAMDKSRATQFQEALLVFDMYRAVGVRITVDPVSHEEFEARRRAAGGRPLLYPSGWYADYPDPDSFLFVLFHRLGGDALQTRYHNPLLDDLIERARRSLDLEERAALYEEAEDLIVEEAPSVFLTHSWGMIPHRPEVMGMKLSFTPPLMRPHHIWLAEGAR